MRCRSGKVIIKLCAPSTYFPKTFLLSKQHFPPLIIFFFCLFVFPLKTKKRNKHVMPWILNGVFFLIVIIIFPFILLLLLIYNSMSKERMSYVFFSSGGSFIFVCFPSFMWLKSSIYLVINLQMAIGLAMPDWFLLQWRSPSFPYRTQHPMTTSVWCRIVREFFLKKKRNKKETKIIQNKQNTRKKITNMITK